MTGSVSKIDAGELESFPVGQFAQKLQGQVAGVQINQSTGQPGKGMGFRIRGAASINGGSSPLFVVDGIPINMDLSSINPDEIETFFHLERCRCHFFVWITCRQRCRTDHNEKRKTR